ncbi:acyl-CoA thioesterase domain-containing protein [Yinghuangia aomiensis]
MFWTIIGLIFTGLIIGLLGRLFLPGRQSIGMLATIGVGILGTLIEVRHRGRAGRRGDPGHRLDPVDHQHRGVGGAGRPGRGLSEQGAFADVRTGGKRVPQQGAESADSAPDASSDRVCDHAGMASGTALWPGIDLADLIAALQLTDTGAADPAPYAARFRARQRPSRLPTTLGGQVLAQAVVAAERVVPGMAVQSIQGVFPRGGVAADPVGIDVEIVQSGRASPPLP